MNKYNKVLLVNPGTAQSLGVCEPLNLAGLAAYLQPRGFEVKIADEVAGQNVAQIAEEFRPDLMGVTATTVTAPDAYRIGALARQLRIPSVMGGVHASVLPEEALAHFDMVVQGEGELALLEILQQGQARGVFRSNATLDLDTCPRPDRNLLDMNYYFTSRQRYSQYANFYFVPMTEHILSLMVGRGCYWNCTYCHNTWRDHKSRNRSAPLVADEMEYVARTYGVKYLCFYDDNLFQYRQLCAELFPELARRKSDLLWGANARVDCVNEENIAAAWAAGCRRVNFGFESGSQRILDILNKRVQAEQFERAVNLCRAQGMIVVGNFMIGNPGETMEDINKTRAMIRRLRVQHVAISITTAFPGTVLWDYCKEKGRIPEKLDWALFDFDHVPVQVSDCFSAPDLMRLHRSLVADLLLHNAEMRAYVLRAFFANPLQIFRRIRAVAFPK